VTIDESSSLTDVCFAVSTALDKHGIVSVLTGGSAATLYAPHAYTSLDADFILEDDNDLGELTEPLKSIGFTRRGRSRLFEHAHTRYTLDFPKGPLGVGRDYITETRIIERGGLRIRILTRTDCIRDRLAGFYYWDDYTALNAAVAVAAENPGDVDIGLLRRWTEREAPGSTELLEKLAEFERRLNA
jgi:hypothetical protein